VLAHQWVNTTSFPRPVGWRTEQLQHCHNVTVRLSVSDYLAPLRGRHLYDQEKEADMEHERAEHAGMADIESARAQRVYERLGWMLLAAGAVLSILAAVITTLPPLYWFTDPRFQNLYPVMTAWSITWLSFNVFALILLALILYKRGERWSW
jgi:hypothetical protein